MSEQCRKTCDICSDEVGQPWPCAKERAKERVKARSYLANRDFSWECNECGSKEYTSAVSEEDVHTYLACGSCGGTEFHRAYKDQE